MNLGAINFDCWLTIIKYLNLNDQLALYEATHGVLNGINLSLVYGWKKQHCFRLDGISIKLFEQMPEVLDIFLSSISATIQELQLKFASVEFLQQWEKYTFSNIETLECIFDDRRCHKPSTDEEIHLLTKLFPRLRCVKLGAAMRQSSRHLRHADWGTWEQGRRGNNCPKGIARWQLLEELTLSYHFRLPFFNDGIVSLPNLQSITFYQNELENDLDEMLKERWKDVHKMILNDCIDKYSWEKLRKLTSLHHLTIVHDEFFTRGIINKVVEKMNQLEQLDLVDFENWYSDDGLWQLVGYCPLLKILNISGMDLKPSFFNVNRSLMEKAMKKHCQTLTLYCGKRDSEIEELFRQHFNHPEVTLSFEPVNVELLNSNMVKIHF